MPTNQNKPSRHIYEQIIALVPEIPTLPSGQGTLLRLSESYELHANKYIVDEDERLILGFYRTGENPIEDFQELAHYEISLNHAGRTVQILDKRQRQKINLKNRLAQIESPPIQRSLIAESGNARINAQLFKTIMDMIPRLDEAESGQGISKKSSLLTKAALNVYVLGNYQDQAYLEFSDTGLDDNLAMSVIVDKQRNMAGVYALGGSGRYPYYLPYPDGMEMHPNEREKFTRELYNRIVERISRTPGTSPGRKDTWHRG